MPSYDLLKEFQGEIDPDADSIDVNPYWLLAVFRFSQPLTFSRSRLFNGDQRVSFNEDNSVIAQTREILVIDSDCVNLSVSQSKGSYVSNLNATLLEGKNYLSEILPSDWVMAWIVNSEEKAKDLKQRLLDPEGIKPCNDFDDGLKFVGRVQSIRKTLQQAGNGLRFVRYNLQALGGKEFDSSIFYDPHLGEKESSIGQFLAKLNLGISDIFDVASSQAAKGKGGIDSNKAIPTILKLLLGDGVPSRFASVAGALQIATGGTSTDEAPYAYAVPTDVGRTLGRNEASKPGGVLTYADVFDSLIGVQKYGTGSDTASVFMPEGVSGGSRLKTPHPLKGEFLPQAIPLTNRPVWSVINQFLNPAVNEMFYVLRPGPNGNVVPTLVVRQLPFSTSKAVDKLGSDVTGFLELPRWIVHPILMRDLDIGRADTAHFNFIHVYGQSSAQAGAQTMTKQIVRNPPIRDEQDIKRNGIRPYMQTVNCSIDDTFKGPRKWMEIVADFLIGQQYTLNGSCTIQGIQAPIAPGDNVEVDGVVFHLESVSHTCSVSPSGAKSFVTSLALTHGVRSDDAMAQGRVPESRTMAVEPPTYLGSISPLINGEAGVMYMPGLDLTRQDSITVAGERNLNPDLYMYSGISPGDNMALGPGMTLEDTDE